MFDLGGDGRARVIGNFLRTLAAPEPINDWSLNCGRHPIHHWLWCTAAPMAKVRRCQHPSIGGNLSLNKPAIGWMSAKGRTGPRRSV